MPLYSLNVRNSDFLQGPFYPYSTAENREGVRGRCERIFFQPSRHHGQQEPLSPTKAGGSVRCWTLSTTSDIFFEHQAIVL